LAGRWQLQDAKNRFSEVVDEAIAHGPQVITRRGKDTAVLLSVEEFRQMNRPTMRVADFFRQSPMCGVDLDLSRDEDPLRTDIEL
jgi:antitoxin Phd